MDNTTVIEWDEEKYELFEPSLWQTLESGKFIGLDHQTALGANGLSLNQFYADYASTEGSNIDGGTKSGGTPVVTGPAVTTEAQNQTTTAAKTEQTKPSTTVTTAAVSSDHIGGDLLYGDANCDNTVDIADATKILQYIGNGDKYTLSAEGELLADCYDPGSGITAMDALAVQKFDAKVIKDLPELVK